MGAGASGIVIVGAPLSSKVTVGMPSAGATSVPVARVGSSSIASATSTNAGDPSPSAPAGNAETVRDPIVAHSSAAPKICCDEIRVSIPSGAVVWVSSCT
ncbi:hypothetical protein SRABI128_02938 [Microbacterium sp. Bi128]|nr:hypothetical protein SRABI128_02938 [Microbacterium sp. Bi128]